MSNLVPEVIKDDKNLAKYEANNVKFIGAMGILNPQNPIVTEKEIPAGNFYDYEKSKALGKELTCVVLWRKFQVRYYIGSGQSATFKESLWLPGDGNWTEDPKRIAKDKEYAGNKTEEGVDYLVYLIDLGIFRHFWCKGKTADGGLDMWHNRVNKKGNFQPSIVKGNFIKIPSGHQWYELDVTPLLDKTVEFPEHAARMLELYKTIKEEAVNEAEKTTKKSGRAR